MSVILSNFKPFIGQHCESTATGTLLKQVDIDLSESLLFGLGEGLGFIFWRMKTMDFPFLGGRVKTDLLTENICRNLKLELDVQETSSTKKAWSNIEGQLSQGRAVGLKLDCYHLQYFNTKIHFAGHYVAMYGYNQETAFLIDTDQQGGVVETSLESLALARSEKGPMSSRNKSYTIQRGKANIDLQAAIKAAIHNNAATYLNPPIKNLTYKGIKKTAAEIKTWFKESPDVKRDFQTTAMLMERAGTGGALFRNLYRDFLEEAAECLADSDIGKAHEDFISIATHWTEVSMLFEKAGETKDIRYINQASEILTYLSSAEKKIMERLYSIAV